MKETAADALAFLRRVIGGRADMLPTDEAIREAAKVTHPDAGGSPENFKRVMKCEQILQGGE
ncbi:MAG: hypothetical protein H0T51_07780 [Pirellulales bacterium]|nr:hypothetical protein [Pirellulales bacterium]